MQKSASLLLIGLLSFVSAACGPKVVSDEDDEPCSAYETYCGTDQEGADICVDLNSNAAHCGSCFNDCREPEANACVGGLCACTGGNGNVSDACDGSTACVAETGQCILPDYGTTEECDPIEGIDCVDERKVCADNFCTIPDCDHPEICDGLDNDCNGHLDGNGPTPGRNTLLTQACYTGPVGTEGAGICHGGTQTCFNGVFAQGCQGEQAPVSEEGFLRCDGLDNDCDTCADDVWNDEGACEPLPPLKADIVFIIDRSGSMSGTITAVISAVQSWATSIGTNPNIRFALIDPTNDNDPDGISMTLPLSNFLTFNAAIGLISADGSATEPMHHAAQLVLSGAFDATLGFAPDSIRIVIAIHDEPTTSGGNDVVGVTETTVCGFVAPNTVLAVITYPDFFAEWDACTSSTDMPATAMPLTSDPATMLTNLDLIIETPCF
ncbi:MAG: vWA domain-containing protein [Patescibacteria group bacterium]|jgi:hypothetical protein